MKVSNIVERVVVTYPGCTIYWADKNGVKKKKKENPRKMKGFYRGSLVSNPDAFIIEDEGGWVHVVAKSIVKFVPFWGNK